MTELLKEGAKHLTGLEETVLKNAEAVKKFSQMMRTSLGPNGMHKMVINHLEKLFVTSDSATIARELEVFHPAAKMVVLAQHQQEAETGDGTNLVVVFAGELMTQAEALIRQGLHPSLIVQGYAKGLKKAMELFEEPSLVAHKVENPRDLEQVTRCLLSVIASKQYGHHEIIAPLVAQACIQVCPKNAADFNVDNVRVAKVLGAGVSDSTIIRGFVVPRDTEGQLKHVSAARVAVYAGGFELPKTETKGTVLVKTAKELTDFNVSEERQMEAAVRALADAGVQVCVSGGGLGELALHYLERYKIMCVKILSKFELRRLCQAIGASPLLNLGAPPADKLGFCDEVNVEEIGSTKCVVFRQGATASQLATIVVRASTQNTLEDIERAIDDGANVYKQLCRDPRFVAGAGACEISLAAKLAAFADAEPGLEQYAIRKYAEAFEVVPRTLAENAGLNATQFVSDLYAHQAAGKPFSGLDIDSGHVFDAAAAGILDHLNVKRQAIEYASSTVLTILRVDQIIMQKPAGGPKIPTQAGGGAMDVNDPDYA